jgi:hypothetical protein
MDPLEDDLDLKSAAAIMFGAGEATVAISQINSDKDLPLNCFVDMERSVHFPSRYDSAPRIPGHGTEGN